MINFPVYSEHGALHPADNARDAELMLGARLCYSCGSQLVTDLQIDSANMGITIALNDEPTQVESTDDFLIETVELEGGMYLNLKLLMTCPPHSPEEDFDEE